MPRPSPRSFRTVLVAALVLVPVACGSDDSSTGGPASTTVSTTDPSSTSESATTEPDAQATTTSPDPLADQTAPESINGITVQGDSLWIASIAEDQILQVDRHTGAILARIDTNGAGPDDVAVAPDGSVWVTGYVSGMLGRVVDGEYEEVAMIEPLINGIDIAADGTVFVATLAEDGTLYRLVPGSGHEAVATGLKMVNAFEVDEATGTILAPWDPMGAPAIVRIDPADGSITPVVEGLPVVMATTMDPDGRLVALDNINGEVLLADVEAGTFEVLVVISDGRVFDNLAYADDGTLYVSGFGAPAAITEVKPDGSVRVIQVGEPPAAAPAGG